MNTETLPEHTRADLVTLEWLKSNALRVPFKPGLHESTFAWVRVNESGYITHASKKDITTLAYLVGNGCLEPCHAECGMAFLELQHAFRARTGLKSNSVYLAQYLAVSGEASSDDTCEAYEHIFNALGKRKQKVIEYACLQPCDVKSGVQSSAGINIYRESFDSLLQASDEVWQALKAKRLAEAA
jgi:hypothetical protein